MTQTWQLFVDESGDFKRRNAWVCAAGVLLLPAHAPSESDVRQRWSALAPQLRWPMHTAYLLRASWAPLVDIAESVLGNDADILQAETARARAVWEANASSTLAGALEQLARAREPKITNLIDLDEALAVHAPEVFRRMQRASVQLIEQLRELVDALQREITSLRVVLAGEAWTPAVRAERNGTATTDELFDSERFVSVVAALVQRAVDYVARMGGRHVLEVTLSRRGVARESGRGYRPMNRHDVVKMLESVERYDGRVEVVSLPPTPFGPSATVWEVLADFVACMANRTLSDKRQSLKNVAAKAEGVTGALLVSRASSFPHVASDGTPHEHVQATIASRPSVWPPEAPCRRWAREQADRVVADLSRRNAIDDSSTQPPCQPPASGGPSHA